MEILKLTSDGFSIWGFDVEWRLQFTGHTMRAHKVGLIQMYRDDVVILFHIAASGIPVALVDVLTHPRIFKVGLNIWGDVNKLARDYDFLTGKINGVVEVRKFARILGIIPANSLAGMVEQLLHKILPKPEHVRCGNWDKVPLPLSWRQYAALDAYASLAVMMAVFQLHLTNAAPPIDRGKYLFELLDKVSKPKFERESRPEVKETISPPDREIFLSDGLLAFVEAFECAAPSMASPSALPSHQKECLALSLSGKSFAEIAQTRNVKTSTVYGYVTAAMQAGHSYDYNAFAIMKPQRNAALVAFLTAYRSTSGANSTDSSEISRIAFEASSSSGCCVEYNQVRLLRLHWQRNLGAEWLSKLSSLNEP